MRFLLEHWPTDEFGAHLDRWKRLRRQGWDLTVLHEYGAREQIIAVGVLELEHELEPEPDRAGRYELPLEV